MPRAQAALSAMRPSLPSPRMLAGTVVVTIILALALLFAWQPVQPWRTKRASAEIATQPVPPATPVLLEPQSFKPLSEIDAVAENALRPLDKRQLEIAFPFILPVSAEDSAAWNRAVHCLALANYYEAASEGDAGMRAVSQVVLNRTRHPAFPHAVCDVVFQGAERASGCQFTFTCDGSLSRPPSPMLFARARAIATEALRGRVEAAVGMATHYHANFVVPYWADQLDKIRTVGRHIFYVWRGGWGNRSAFREIYTVERSNLRLPYMAEPALAVAAVSDAETAHLASGYAHINLDFREPGSKLGNRTLLVADEPAGTLKLDEDGNAGTLRAQPLLSRVDDRDSQR